MFVKGFMTGLLESLFTMLLNISAIRLNDKSGSSQEEKDGKLWKKKVEYTGHACILHIQLVLFILLQI